VGFGLPQNSTPPLLSTKQREIDSRMADNSPRTDTSTDLEADAKVDNWLDDGHHGATVVSNTSDHEATRNGDSKVWQSTFSIPPIFLCTGAGS
jgi:hypothetical protein